MSGPGGSGDHLGQQRPGGDPGGGGNSMLAAAAKRMRQEMTERIAGRQNRPPLPASRPSSSLATPSLPTPSLAPSDIHLENQLDGAAAAEKQPETESALEIMARKIQ